MKKRILTAMAIVMMLAVAGCSANTTTEPTSASQTEQGSSDETKETTKAEESSDTAATTGESSSDKETNTAEDDSSLSADSEQLTDEEQEFAQKIAAAVSEKDLEALADLSGYPVNVGIEGTSDITDKEAFLALDAEMVFTDELVEAIENCDLSALTKVEAGIVMANEGTANIIFNTIDGECVITGINY